MKARAQPQGPLPADHPAECSADRPEGRPPQAVEPLAGLWVFAPNRDTQGGTAWWLDPPGGGGDGGLLIDCPALTQANLSFLRSRGAGTLVLTGRHGHGSVRRWQQALGWPVLVQEQEAYLLPGVERLVRFAAEHSLAAGGRLRWTPGPSPGASVLFAAAGSEGLLFCGRLLVPVAAAALAPLRTPSTFHWSRQLRSLACLRSWLVDVAPPGLPIWLASGAGLGALRGGKVVPDALRCLGSLDFEAIRLEAEAELF